MQQSWIYLIVAGVLALVLAACALPQQSGTSTTNSPHPSDMSGMDHDSMETSDQAPFDAQFIDGMTRYCWPTSNRSRFHVAYCDSCAVLGYAVQTASGNGSLGQL